MFGAVTVTREVAVAVEVEVQVGVVPMHEQAVLTMLARLLVSSFRAADACAVLIATARFSLRPGWFNVSLVGSFQHGYGDIPPKGTVSVTVTVTVLGSPVVTVFAVTYDWTVVAHTGAGIGYFVLQYCTAGA